MLIQPFAQTLGHELGRVSRRVRMIGLELGEVVVAAWIYRLRSASARA